MLLEHHQLGGRRAIGAWLSRPRLARFIVSVLSFYLLLAANGSLWLGQRFSLWHDAAMSDPPRRIPYRTWPGAFAVLVAILAYVGSLMAWDRHVPGGRELEAGHPVVLGHVRFLPADGWRMDVSRSRFGRSLSLFRGPHRFEVNIERWEGGPAGPLSRLQRLMERGRGLRIKGSMSAFFNTWGLEGTTFAYYGPQLAGRFWQAVDTRRRVLIEVDFHGPDEDLGAALEEARSMVDSMDLGAP